MKKGLLVSLILAVVVFTFGTVNTASAKSVTPASSDFSGYFGFGGRGGRMGGVGTQTGILHDAMIEYLASKLGVSVDELNTRLAAGETMYQIALSEGLTQDEFTTLMDEARDSAIDQAVSDGTITQAQTDLMKSNDNMMASGSGSRRSGGAYRGMNGTGVCINQ